MEKNILDSMFKQKILHVMALFQPVTVKQIANELNHEPFFIASIVQEMLDYGDIEIVEEVKNHFGFHIPAFQIKKVKA